MDILKRIVEIKNQETSLRNEKDKLIRDYSCKGGTWQELAMVDKFAGIRLCKEQNQISLLDANEIVFEFLEKNKR